MSWKLFLKKTLKSVPGAYEYCTNAYSWFRSKSNLKKNQFIPHLKSLTYLRKELRNFPLQTEHHLSVMRYYWDIFLSSQASNISGHVLEIGTTSTVLKYGDGKITKADAIDIISSNPEVTIIADLMQAWSVPDNQFDCFLNQFTMHVMRSPQQALYHSIRILKPSGTLLINFPCFSSPFYPKDGIGLDGVGVVFPYIWFTPAGVVSLLDSLNISSEHYQISVYGNLLTRICNELNVGVNQILEPELQANDDRYPLLICVSLRKPTNWDFNPDILVKSL